MASSKIVSARVAMSPKTSDRSFALLKFTLELLNKHSDGLRPRDIFQEVETNAPSIRWTKSIEKDNMIRIRFIVRTAGGFLETVGQASPLTARSSPQPPFGEIWSYYW